MTIAVRVLVVEDEWLIAEDLKGILEALGLQVLGPAPNCAKALDILYRERPDLAFIDTQLATETCEAVLEECRRLAIRVVICSGHSEAQLPRYCWGFPLMQKPLNEAEIARLVSAVTLPA
jgi:two-component SAPR family response regulator